MRTTRALKISTLFAVAVWTFACGGCDTADNSGDGGSSYLADGGAQAGDAAFAPAADAERADAGPDVDGSSSERHDADATQPGLDAADAGDGGSDAAQTDVAPSSTCGDSVVESGEVCDDGNTQDGDYCAHDCSAETGRCGDGVVQSNENCDDAMTTDCSSTHDGGDGTCLAAGNCSPGYVLDVNGACIANPTGLSEPCQNGSGWSMFRFQYSNNSTSAQIDVWDASCSYSFAPNSACNVREVYPGFGEVSRTSEGYPIFTSSNYLRVRFSAAGLNFSKVTLWIRARSYATSSSTFYDAWSPLYGELEGGPVDNDFVYDWYALDWTGYLYPYDDPSLTAIQVYGGRGSGSLAVRAVELCVE